MSESKQPDVNPFDELVEQINSELNTLEQILIDSQARIEKIAIKAVRTGIRINPSHFRNKEGLKLAVKAAQTNIEKAVTELKQQLQVERELSNTQLQVAEESRIRAVAEAENTRARMKREESNIQRRAIRPIAQNLITVADNFERTSQSIGELNESTELESFTQGVELSITAFTDALNRSGIESYGETDAPFDPNIHEAIAMVPNPDLKEQTVIEIQRVGYKMNDEVLRPAQVVVGKPVEVKDEVEDSS